MRNRSVKKGDEFMESVKRNSKTNIARKAISIMLALVLCIAMTVTAFAATTTTTNTKLDLNGRSGPGTNYSVVVKIPPKSTVTTTGSTKNGFTQVKYNGKTCWVSSEYVGSASNSSTEKTAYTTNTSLNLNMRAKASSSSNVVKKIPPQSKITVYGNKTNGFYYASYGGKKGYVSADYVSFSKPETNTVTGFSSRTSAPSSSNQYFYSNKNPFYSAGYKGQCTWYAYGRAYEILGSKPKVSTGNAKTWYTTNKKNGTYSYGSKAKVGAIACWGANSYSSAGHVAVVEKINSDGTVMISEFNKSGDKSFHYRKLPSTSGFQGYIYLK